MMPPSGVAETTINEVMAVRGVGAQVLGAIPVLERLRLRRVCRAFLSAVDESLEDVSELFWDDVADAARSTGGLEWLTDKCPRLQTLSLWPRTPREVIALRDQMHKMKGGLISPGMATQSWSILSRCKRLRSLNLAGCSHVDDTLLAAMAASCTELESLDVGYCRVTDRGITEVAVHCRNLKELSAGGGRKVTDESMKQLAACCRQLQRLDVAETAVTNDGISAVARHCRDLRHLAVRDCKGVMDDAITVLAEHCPTLQYLDVGGLKFVTDASITAVAMRCPALKGLDLHGCANISDDGIRAVAAHCPQLESLHFWIAGLPLDPPSPRTITPVLLELARNCPRLQLLNAMHCEVCDDVILELATNCPQLRHLTIGGSLETTDASIAVLAEHCPQLEHLCIWACELVTDVGVSAVARHCPRMRHLDLRVCDNVTDASITLVAEHCRELEEFKVSVRRSGVTEASLRLVASNCTRLRSFDISEGLPAKVSADNGQAALCALVESCRNLEHLGISGAWFELDECMTIIGRNCTRLRSLVAHNCPSLTDDDVALMLVGPAAGGLQHLDLSGRFCDSITDASLAAIGRTCTQLRTLNLWLAKGVTDVGIKAVSQGCRHLTYLNVTGCKNVTRDALSMFDLGKCELIGF